RRRGHDPVAGLEILDLAADGLDFAGTLEPDPRAHAADGTMLDAGGNQRVGAVEARGADLDQNFVWFRLGLRQVTDLNTLFAENCCFHDHSSRWPRCAIVRPRLLQGATDYEPARPTENRRFGLPARLSVD